MHFYLDESGDLGWNFDKPYRYGGSSRYLTIAVLQVPAHKKHLPKRIIRNLYKKYHWATNTEKKWSKMKPEERLEFARQTYKLVIGHPDIRLWAIVATKQNTQAHIRQDANKLYNFMIKLLLLDEMSHHATVKFIPDPRSIKVESGNSLHDYIQTELWFTKNVSTVLTTRPCDSGAEMNIQFADMLSGVVQHHFEDNKTDAFRILKEKLSVKKLFHR